MGFISIDYAVRSFLSSYVFRYDGDSCFSSSVVSAYWITPKYKVFDRNTRRSYLQVFIDKTSCVKRRKRKQLVGSSWYHNDQRHRRRTPYQSLESFRHAHARPILPASCASSDKPSKQGVRKRNVVGMENRSAVSHGALLNHASRSMFNSFFSDLITGRQGLHTVGHIHIRFPVVHQHGCNPRRSSSRLSSVVVQHGHTVSDSLHSPSHPPPPVS